MPGIEDWKTRPYATIQKLFEENEGCSQDDFVAKVQEYFSQRLDPVALLQVPSLNSVPLDQLRSGTLVKYRCMVQDVFDPQFCLGRYKVVDTSSQVLRVECGSFRDIPAVGAQESVDYDSGDGCVIERQGFYCVPIPGEAEWVKQAYDKFNIQCKVPPSSSSSSRSKRGRETDETEFEIDQKSSRENKPVTEEVEMKYDEDSIKNLGAGSPLDVGEADSSRSSGTEIFNKNLPLPEETGVPCIVRVYSKDVELKTTDAVEFVGILSIDPQLASIYDDDINVDDVADQAELQAHEPPPSLVPRLHALVARPLHHNNPNLPPVPTGEQYKTDVTRLMEDACSLRLELLSALEHALLSDRLAAEYLLCSLISRVYARADVLPLGKLSVNISGCPGTQRYTKFLHHLISQLTSQTALLEMSIENLNSLKLVPKKDYKVNRITAGMLQLAAGTHLVLDETALQQGQLDHAGVSNVKALADVINWQKVDYDFEWHPIPVHTDVNVLILSEGESLLPKDIHVPLITRDGVPDVPEHFSKLDCRLTPENMAKLRSYITACRLLNYTVSEETQKVIQDDFVQTRQSNPKDMSVDDFQRLLGLVRVLTLSFGQTSPSVEMWTKVKAMEEERKARIASLPGSRRDNQ